jgi:hypothetical protein
MKNDEKSEMDSGKERRGPPFLSIKKASDPSKVDKR